MRARFRVRTTTGRELTPASLDSFARLVRSGEISSGDLIYDALTGEWAPGRAHPVYRMVEDCVLPIDDGLRGLSLAVPASEPTQEEAEAAFVVQMEEERRSDPDRRPALDDMPLLEGGSVVVTGVVESPRTPPPPGGRPSKRALVDACRPAPRRREAPIRGGSRRSSPNAAPPGGRVMWMIGAFSLLTFTVTASPPIPENRTWPVPAQSSVAALQLRRRAVTEREESARRVAAAAAAARALGLMDELGATEIPPIWLELDGAYLADAADHPDVRETWERYLAFVRAVRASAARLYRESYLALLDGDGIEGAPRSLRLAAAIRDFDAERPTRESVYAAVEELAVAALSLHDLLVHLSGSITHEPVDGSRLSLDPVLEAAGRDESTQALLEAALDRVLRSLEQTGTGPLDLDRIPAWVSESVEDALTR